MEVVELLNELYVFNWACSRASLDILIDTTHYVAVHRIHDNCIMDLALCHPKAEIGNWFVKVRKPPYGLENFPLLCEQLQKFEECDFGDSCTKAHSREELTIWTTIQDRNLNFDEVFSLLKIKLCQIGGSVKLNDVILPSNDVVRRAITANNKLMPVISRGIPIRSPVPIESCDLEDDSVFTPALSDGDDDNNKFDLSLSDSQNNEKENVVPVLDNHRMIEVPDLCAISELTRKFALFASCLKCYDYAKSEVLLIPHKCDQQILVCREKQSTSLVWKPIRPRSTTLLPPNVKHVAVCHQFPRACNQSIQKCPFAHSIAEQTIWNKEIADRIVLIPDSLLSTVLKCQILTGDYAFDLPVPVNKKIMKVHYWAGCEQCAFYVTKAYFVIYAVQHECERNLHFVRLFSWHNFYNFWILIRSFDPKWNKTAAANSIICRHVMKNECVKLTSCAFPHSEIEKDIWMMAKSRKLALEDFLQNHLQNWQHCCTHFNYLAPPPPKEIKRPNPILNTTNASGASSISPFTAAANAKEQIHTFHPSPYQVHYVCNLCFSRINKISFQDKSEAADKCEYKKEPHSWSVHKTLRIFNVDGTSFPLRPLPSRLKQRLTKLVPPICRWVDTKQGCTRGVCNFAHSELEMRCWRFLSQHNLDVYDIVSKPQQTEIRSTGRSKVAFPLYKLVSAVPSTPAQNTNSDFDFLSNLYCFLCNKTFANDSKYKDHVSTQDHKDKLEIDTNMLDIWMHRDPRCPPPFKYCERFQRYHVCDSSDCVGAHTEEELKEWTERIRFIESMTSSSTSTTDSGSRDLLNQIKSRLLTSKTDLDFATIDLNGSATVTKVSNEGAKKIYWKFSIDSQQPLRYVVLTKTKFCSYFRLYSPFDIIDDPFLAPGKSFLNTELNFYEVQVEFLGTQCRGTFTQRVVFDFGAEYPLVERIVTVNIGVSDSDLQKQSALLTLLKTDDRWTPRNVTVHWISKNRSEIELDPMDVVKNLWPTLNEQNYLPVMKKLIAAEELRRQAILASFRLIGRAKIMLSLVPDDDYHQHPIYPHNESGLFAHITVNSHLSEDYDVTNLLVGDCRYAFVALPADNAKNPDDQNHVYEVEVVGRQNYGYDGIKNDTIFLCLSSSMVKYRKLKPDDEVPMEVQFNFSRNQFKRLGQSLDLLADKQLSLFVFPNLRDKFSKYVNGTLMNEAKIKCPQLIYMENQWKQKWNAEQQQLLKHVVLCALNKDYFVPPLLVYGPFGTGKTCTIAEAAGVLLTQPNLKQTKILICSQANRTAELYIKELEKRFPDSQLKSILWRIFLSHTTLASVSPFMKPYVRLERIVDEKTGKSIEKLERLTLQKLKSIRLVVCTTSGASRLIKLLKKEETDSTGESSINFTHIFLDEAAQALEVEMLQPLCLANYMTCVVVAGDHHQLKPTIYLPECENLNYTYLERLYNYYNDQEQTFNFHQKQKLTIPKLLFSKNYRSHPDILAFVSTAFYGHDSALEACVNLPTKSDNIEPMYFAASFGPEKIAPGSISSYNDSEVETVMYHLEYFWNNWPVSWGEKDIGIAVSTYDQAKRLREELHRGKYPSNHVYVHKVIQMQGYEFKVMIISTVTGADVFQTYYLNANQKQMNRKNTFLDDARLLNTAFTRARYCVMVVGNPVVLCGIGACKDIWSKYIAICFQKKTFFEAENDQEYTWVRLQNEIDAATAHLV